MNEVARKLENAISAYDGDTGPVIWSVREKDENSAYLEGTYSEDIYLEEEVWTKYGGDAIMRIAVVEFCDSGMYYFQDRFGERFVCQWALFDGDQHFSQSRCHICKCRPCECVDPNIPF